MIDNRLNTGAQSVYDWFEQTLGRTLQANEVDRLRPVLSGLYAVRALQIGRTGSFDYLSSCDAPMRYIVDTLDAATDNHVQATPEALPFDAASIDLVLLPHTLDFSADPHQVLREVERVLVPEGHIVILGFNPASFFGLKKLFTWRRRRRAPWNANFIGLRRMKDWLALMHFEITGGSMLYYRPPVSRTGLLDRLFFLDKMGDRWWPMMAGVYLLVAKKRVAGMTVLRPQWRFQLIKNGVGEPTNCEAVRKTPVKQVMHG